MKTCQTIVGPNDERCGEPPAFRFTWPGKDEAYACQACAQKIRAVARAIEMHLQMIPLPTFHTAAKERAHP